MKKNKKQNQQQKNNLPQDMSFRAVPIKIDSKRGVPESLDVETRSVEVTGATENPVIEYCRERWEFIPTILLMSGCQIPESRQIVLLDTHQRWDTSSVVGSYREMRVENSELVGRSYYSEADEAEGPWRKTAEGHLPDYSVGRRDVEAVYIPEGEKQTIEGREFEGPVKVVTKWIPKEMSVCPIGADEFAKARADRPQPEIKTEEKENAMNEKLRKFLEIRGLSKDATEQEAWAFLETLDVRTEDLPDGKSQKDIETRAAAEGAQQEQTRIIEIRSICTKAGIEEDVVLKHITDGTSVEKVRSAAFDHVLAKKQDEKTPGHRQPAEVGRDARDKFKDAAGDSLMVRAGLPLEDGRELAAGHDELTGLTLRELARESLRVAGLSIKGNPMEMIGRALTTSDLPFILGDASNRALLTGFEMAEETWDQWCDTGSVSDFRSNQIGRASETQDLDEIGEDGEFKYDKLSDKKETFNIATYGKILPISRQAIINDDLGALTNIPMKHGEAWARKLGDLAYAVLTANAAMGDGTALFHADHGNLGSAGAISETTVAEMIKLMKKQKDVAGKRRLNISPVYFIAPVALEGSAEIFFNSNQFAGADTAATRTNPYAGSRFTRVYEPRLDDDSETAWYMAGRKGKTVRIFFLNGQQLPYLEMRNGWTVDGVEFKVRGDAGAKALDWVALGKNAGS